MRPILKSLVWLLLFASLLAGAQKGPTNQAGMAGLSLTLTGCTLAGDTLRCTVEVVNPQPKAISVNIAPASVLAVTSSGWLYQGQVSASSLRLDPNKRTTLTLTFRGVKDSPGLFALIQVGEARFLGVVVPGAPKLTAKGGYCFYGRLWGFGDTWQLACHLDVSNDTGSDLLLRLNPLESFAISELGSKYAGVRVVVGEEFREYGEMADLTIPAGTVTRIGVIFDARYGQQQGFLLQKMQLVRFRVGGGFLELRDVPVKYCGQEADKPCDSWQPF